MASAQKPPQATRHHLLGLLIRPLLRCVVILPLGIAAALLASNQLDFVPFFTASGVWVWV